MSIPAKREKSIPRVFRMALVGLCLVAGTASVAAEADVETRVSALLERMTTAEKIGLGHHSTKLGQVIVRDRCSFVGKACCYQP